MLSFGEAFYALKNRLQPLYDDREAAAIAHGLLEHITGLSKSQRLIEKETLFSLVQQQSYDVGSKRLAAGMPLQYATGRAWFMGAEYKVNEHVLIPRPETEELVQWIINDNKTNHKLSILDIGTGSGCIPISLKRAIPEANLTSCDIIAGALTVAESNASSLQAEIKFTQLDFLNESQRNKLDSYDVIVSNPPYIPAAEKEQLHVNVTAYEPAAALFVPNDDALVFYRAIALFGKEHLKTKGHIYCELDAGHAMECKALFEANGYSVELRKDMHDNWRMLKATMNDNA